MNEVKKAYTLRTNKGLLFDNLYDFSQAVMTDVIYVVLGDEQSIDDVMVY